MHAIANEKQQLRQAALVAGSFGIEIAAYVGLGFMGGPWLDHRLHTEPWFKLLGYVVGVGAPINALVRIVRQYNQDLKKQDLPSELKKDDPPPSPSERHE